MVRQRKRDANKQSGSRPTLSPKQAKQDSCHPKDSPKVPTENMQYISNSRSKARLIQSGPSPSLIKWLLRLRVTRMMLVLVVTAGAGFMFGRAFHWGLTAGPDGSFDLQRDLRPHRNENHQNMFDQKGINSAKSHAAEEKDGPLQQPVLQPALPERYGIAEHHSSLSKKERIAKQRAENKYNARLQFEKQQRGAQQMHAEQHQPAQHQPGNAHQQQADQQHVAPHAPQHAAQNHAAQQLPIVKQAGDPNQSAKNMAANQPADQQAAGQESPKIKKPVIQDAPSDIEIYPYHVIQTLTNTHKLPHLKNRFIECTKSILGKASINLHFFFVVDKQSKEFVMETMQDITNQHIAKSKFQFHFIEVDELAHQLAPLVSMLVESVSGGHPYYQDTIFFLSVAIHRGILPSYVKRIVMLDTDLKFMTDIKELFDHFNHFTTNNIMGMAREMQPVYRHLLSQYRNQNKGTKAGDPPPDGLTGFNSGVMLLDLEKMRTSTAYQGFINKEKIHEISQKYHFKGHLGDQDFFSLISLDRPDLFYILPCSWNRQLCVWWKDKGYKDIFDLYFKCEEKINVYHGNCNTPIPY